MLYSGAMQFGADVLYPFLEETMEKNNNLSPK